MNENLSKYLEEIDKYTYNEVVRKKFREKTMPNDKWDNLTNDTNDLIQKAIDSGNYNSLRRDVTSTIERAVKSAIDIGIRTVENPPVDFSGKQFKEGKRTVKVNLDGNTVEINERYADRIRKPNFSGINKNVTEFKSPIKFKKGRYISNFRLSFGGYNKAFWGGLLGFGSLGAASDVFVTSGDMVGFLFLILLGLSSLYMGYSGIRTISNKGKFRKYVDIISLSKTEDYADISDLASATNESEKKTLKRVKFMIRKHWFKEGFLDRFEKTLMTSKEAYKLYKNSEDSLIQRQKEEEERVEKEEEKSKKLPREAREVLATGAAYLRQMKELNDRIPGEEVSDKISKIEALTARILARIESHPESVDETKQMMKYYLPMMIKLLNAYAEMDEQPKPGQNIENSKREIEGVLDELNLAFEKLLDNLYKDTAWDVSSDISVLNAMLKRNGLKGNDFSTNTSMNLNSENDGEIKLKL